MKTKFRLITIIIALFLFMSPMNFASTTDLTIMLDDEILEMPLKPYEISDEIMVDTQCLFEALGLSVQYYPQTNEIVGYRNNIFVRIEAATNSATKNGKTFTMPVNARVAYITGETYEDQGLTVLDTESKITYDKERLFAPISFLAETFDIDLEWMDSNTLLLHQGQSNAASKYMMNNLFNEQALKNIDGVIFIPEYWTKHETTPNTFYYSDDFETYNLEVQKIETETDDLRKVDEEIKNSELVLYGDALSLTGTQTKKLNDKSGLVSYSTLNMEAEAINRIRYLISIQDQIYLIQGTYNQRAVESTAIKMFDNIVSTFTISNINIDTDEEYFFQTDTFFELETTLNEEIYSNMDINGSLNLSGNFNTSETIDKLRITVEKGNQSKVYVVPVENNSFDYTVFTPFKLGKHNITVSVPKDQEPPLDSEYLNDGTDDNSAYSFKLRALVNAIENHYSDSSNYDELLKLSVINTSAKESLYLIPSEYINSENNAIYNSAMVALENVDNRSGSLYEAQNIFKYITDHYTLDISDKDSLLTSQEVFYKKSGNELEMANLYTAMLRSIDIPARVIRGTSLTADEYWTECYINGQWQKDNIGWALRFKILTNSKPYRFFNMQDSDLKTFSETYILPF